MVVIRTEVGIRIQFLFLLVSIMNLEILLGSLVHSFTHSLIVGLFNKYLLSVYLCARDCDRTLASLVNRIE